MRMRKKLLRTLCDAIGQGKEREMDSERFFSSDKKLKMLAASYEEMYFKDMRFELKELKDRYFKYQMEFEGKLETVYDDPAATRSLSLLDEYVFYHKEIEGRNLAGICDDEKREIWVDSKNVTTEEDLKLTLLHEMIHGYESLLFFGYQQILVLFLYDKLQKRIGKKRLDRMIRFDQNSVMWKHTLLFSLKSLNIDLARRLPLGTVYSYGREDMFS
jgi:hypothetical protein